jgi:hypothetical protein
MIHLCSFSHLFFTTPPIRSIFTVTMLTFFLISYISFRLSPILTRSSLVSFWTFFLSICLPLYFFFILSFPWSYPPPPRSFPPYYEPTYMKIFPQPFLSFPFSFSFSALSIYLPLSFFFILSLRWTYPHLNPPIYEPTSPVSISHSQITHRTRKSKEFFRRRIWLHPLSPSLCFLIWIKPLPATHDEKRLRERKGRKPIQLYIIADGVKPIPTEEHGHLIPCRNPGTRVLGSNPSCWSQYLKKLKRSTFAAPFVGFSSTSPLPSASSCYGERRKSKR